MTPRHHGTDRRGPPRGGFTIIEVMVVLTMVAVMIAMAVPSFQRSIEQLKADVAVANLRAVWSAERFYWMDARSYTGDLSQLRSLDLIDPSIVDASTPYTYSVSITAGGGFVATASRVGSGMWAGGFSIDQDGTVTGSVQAAGEPDITPAAH